MVSFLVLAGFGLGGLGIGLASLGGLDLGVLGGHEKVMRVVRSS